MTAGQPRAVRLVLLGLVAGLAGCEGSARFGELGRGLTGPPSPPAAAAPPPLLPAPAGRAAAEALPPPPGARARVAPAPNDPGLPPAGSSLPIEDQAAPQQQAGLAPPPPPPPPEIPRPPAPPASSPTAPQPPPTRMAAIGNWQAREATGGTCRITLSSTPALDLYRASSSGCQSRELQRINAWELSGEQLTLYEPGGAVVARLRRSGAGFAGTTARSGAPVALQK